MDPRAPRTERDDVVETLHGQRVADPYRWLEDPDSERTRAWVAEQREYAEQVLGELPERDFFTEVMRRVTTRPRQSAPWRSKGFLLQTRNTGGQLQDVTYIADGLDELLAGGRVLVDPNTWSSDGTSSLAFLTISPSKDLVAVGRSDAGSDWTSISLVTPQGEPVDDAPITTKFSRATWLPDGRSYLYNTFPGAGRADGSDATVLPPARLVRHRVGDDPSQDQLVWDSSELPRATAWPVVSDDEKWLVLHVSVGTERSNRVWLYPLTTEDGATRIGERLELVDEPTAAWSFVGDHEGELFFSTDDDAANGRVVAIDASGWLLREVVPEGAHAIQAVELAGDVLLVEHLVDASPSLRRYRLRGELLGEVPLQAGSLAQLSTSRTSPDAFLGLSTVTEPLVPWRLDAVTGELEQLPTTAGQPDGDDGWVSPAFTVERRRATSKDGTEVPYFLVLPQGAAGDAEAGPRPTILYGYGGFSIPVHADFRATWPGWLAAGGAIAIANLRGGGEFGRDWYDGGRTPHKQNTFDDAIAVAEQLVADGTSTPGQLAVLGKSNGGLLAGALLTERPELFAAALPHVGVLDLLRFHRFTFGAAWISDYGNPDERRDFEAVLALSPLHRIVEGTRYPATLVLTSDHDDRVVPAHSYKFAAALQAAQGGDAPVVARIEPATGHGLASKPPEVAAAEAADMLAFAAHFTGLVPPAVG